MKVIHSELKGYNVMRGGGIISYHKVSRGKELRTSSRNGYQRVKLYREDGSYKSYSVHRLVAEKYIPNTGKKKYVNHKDGNKANNRVENLEWVTASENTKHSYKHNLQPVQRGERNGMSILKEKQVERIVKRLKNGETGISLALEYNVCPSAISKINRGINWKHI